MHPFPVHPHSFFSLLPTFHLLPLKLPPNSFLVFSGSPVPPLRSPGPTSSLRQALPCPDTAVGTLFMPQIPYFSGSVGAEGWELQAHGRLK